jgi:integrase
MAKTLTTKAVENFKPSAARYEVPRLTAKNVRDLPLPEGKSDHVYWDESITGFGLRVRASGARVTRVLIFQYGRQPTRRMKLGTVGAVSMEEARATAQTLYHRVQLGEDPAAEVAERKTKNAETFEAILRTYLEWKRARMKLNSMIEVERHLTKYAKPLHALPLAKVERRQIAALLAQLAQDSGMVTANRVRASLSAFFSWCIQSGIADSNPVTGTAKEKERARERVLSPDEIRLIWNTLPASDFGNILKLLTLTGCRAGEIASLRWDEVRDDQIVLPPERVKNGRTHIIPLSDPARAILAAQSRRGNREFVFGMTRTNPFSGWGKCKDALDEAIAKTTGKPLDHWTPHDLRRTAATMMAEDPLSIPPHIIEAVLNHVSGHKSGIAGIYNRASYEAEKRTALTRWAEHLAAIIEGRESNVVTLRHA